MSSRAEHTPVEHIKGSDKEMDDETLSKAVGNTYTCSSDQGKVWYTVEERTKSCDTIRP